MTSEELADAWSRETDTLALAFARLPDDRVEAALAAFRTRVLARFGELLPDADPAQLAAVADALVAEIQARRREIEAAGAGQAQGALT